VADSVRVRDERIDGTVRLNHRADDDFLDRFLSASSTHGALRVWFERAPPPRDSRDLGLALNRDVGAIDRLIEAQVNAILHHPDFQRLEASWRGLAFLTRRDPAEVAPSIKVKLLDVAWTELARDFDRAIDFDQSELFRKVYEGEFGSPGGEPFGALIGDYEIRPRLADGARYDDLDVLASIAGVAAAAFCPFITNASPSLLGLGDFTELERTLDHAHHMRGLVRWQALRDHEDVRFVGLALPRILMRLPYRPDGSRVDGFTYSEDVAGGYHADGPDHRKFLWGGAAFALGDVIIRAFENSAWPADIRGVRRGFDAGGLVKGLVVDEPGTDSPGVAQKYTTDVVITDNLEKQLGDLGFIPLCQCFDTPYAAFYSVPSIQKPRPMDRAVADVNARLSSMIPYMLCVSRFAHYIKVMGRDRVGQIGSTEQLERVLQDWLTRYTVLDDDATPETKARNPLREAKVQVVPKPGAPGSYRCVIHLVPHYELDDMAVKVRLTTEISSPRTT
jgi:type VI secretion system ImpC/EvpB family protein